MKELWDPPRNVLTWLGDVILFRQPGFQKMNIDDLKIRIDELIRQAQIALRNVRQTQYSMGPVMQAEEWTALRAAGLAFIESTFGCDHSYYKEFNDKLTDAHEYCGKYALGILTAMRDQIRGGWIESTKGLVSAEVFSDFLEMAEYLLDQKYKDPAAVVVGSVLEEHLRQVCKAASLPIEDLSHGQPHARKADNLNADLARSGKYTKLDQKQVTAWLDLRNKAAHGRYSEYSNEQVTLMLAGVRDFVSRVRP